MDRFSTGGFRSAGAALCAAVGSKLDGLVKIVTAERSRLIYQVFPCPRVGVDRFSAGGFRSAGAACGVAVGSKPDELVKSVSSGPSFDLAALIG